jgi:hypothetical protein
MKSLHWNNLLTIHYFQKYIKTHLHAQIWKKKIIRETCGSKFDCTDCYDRKEKSRRNRGWKEKGNTKEKWKGIKRKGRKRGKEKRERGGKGERKKEKGEEKGMQKKRDGRKGNSRRAYMSKRRIEAE